MTYFCRCDNPLEHTIDTVLQQEPNLRFSEETKKKLQKCLTTSDAGKEDGPAADDIINDRRSRNPFRRRFYRRRNWVRKKNFLNLY